MSDLGECRADRARHSLRRSRALFLSAGFALISIASADPAYSRVRITGLSDVTFGTISNLTVDSVQSQSVCAFSNGSGQTYSVRADGSGAGGAFTLSSGSATLAYGVRWNNQPGQSNGTALTAGASLGGQSTNAQNQLCSNGPPTTASLIVTLPATSLSSATAGNYSGTLTIILAEE